MGRVVRVLGALSRLVPDAMISRMLPTGRSFDPAMLPRSIHLDVNRAVRLLVASDNSAGQGEAWARAVRDHVPRADAVALHVARTSVFGHLAAVVVPPSVFAWSGRWQSAHRSAVAREVTHVLVESGRPVLAGGLRGDIDADLAWLGKNGILVALVWHGSDVRDPVRHAALNPLSPYRDTSWADVEVLRARSAANRVLARESGLVSLVSTFDLLDDVPGARWLPVVVNPSTWAASTLPLAHGGPPRVVHAPSSAVVKGTALVEPIARRLHEAGVIEYRRLDGAAHVDMPAIIAGADIVLDQFLLGSYGVAAVEALAAGRIVVGHLTDPMREGVRHATGIDVPILSARPEGLEELLRGIAADPAAALAVAATGPEFVAKVHDGRRSAAVIAEAFGLSETP